jgi:uncharacterized protein YbgA (DUF1722 family)/uncharacterized protein YbbK (DUF523 family)
VSAQGRVRGAVERPEPPAGSAGQASVPSRVRIGISMCLLGERVRFDGGHKRDAFLVETFGRFVEWVPVCPEVESGLPTPRDTLRLVRADGGLRMVMPRSGLDHTDAMRTFALRRVTELAAQDLCGCVLKKDSPSCGMERVKVYEPGGVPTRSGRGLFAEALLRSLPSLPVEEEGRLYDPRLRDNFVERVFAYRRLRDLFVARWTAADLVRFHTAHKLTLLAHSPSAYQELGRLVASAGSRKRAELRDEYERGFMSAMAVIATPKRHTNVLQHMVGYLKDGLDRASRDELLQIIDDYRLGLVPLIVPMTLLQHHVRRHGVGYLAGQVYLAPHPRELMLRNHV